MHLSSSSSQSRPSDEVPYLSFPQERQHRGRSLPFSDERTEWWGPGMLPSAGFTAVSGELVISARHCPSWAGVHRMVAVFPWLVYCTGFDYGYCGRSGIVRRGPVDGRCRVRDRILLTPVISPSQRLEGLL